MTRIPAGSEADPNIIEAMEAFRNKEISDLVDTNRAIIYRYAGDMLVGNRDLDEPFTLDLSPPRLVENNSGTISNREEYNTVVEATLNELRGYFQADNKLGIPEKYDKTRVFWSANFIENGQPLMLTVRETHDDSDSHKLPVSAIAYISKPRSRFNILNFERLQPKTTIAKRLSGFIFHRGK